jgi:hypothetical protein
MFERREVDLGKQSLRPDQRHNGGAPVSSLFARGTAAHLAAADVTRLQRAVGNRGITALLSRQPAVSISPIPVQRCGEPGCDCVEYRTAPDIEVQRDDKAPAAPGSGSAAPPVVAPPPTPTGTVVPFVVRDPSIGVGGPLVADLNALKAALMNRKDSGQWSLMLSIHGSGDRLAAQAPPDWTLNAKFYDAAEIKQLFGDKAFTDWRDQYGPQRVVLVACQVSQAFNQLVVDSLSRSGKGLSAGGLGPGCKPIATTQSIIFQATGAKAESTYKQRAQYDALNPSDKATFEGMLRDLNNKWGYFGAPPVPDADLLRYYFDEVPKGAWVLVEVNKKDDPTSDTLRPLGTPYWNRWADSTFMRECNPMARP